MAPWSLLLAGGLGAEHLRDVLPAREAPAQSGDLVLRRARRVAHRAQGLAVRGEGLHLTAAVLRAGVLPRAGRSGRGEGFARCLPAVRN